jgi:putative transcriptional regulator
MSRKVSARRRVALRAMDEALFADLRASDREGVEILRGERAASRTSEVRGAAPHAGRGGAARVTDSRRGTPDVVALRARFQLSQAKFAALLGISTATLRNWEQGRRTPEGPARVLLQVAARHPEAVLNAVAGGREVWQALGRQTMSGGPSRLCGDARG